MTDKNKIIETELPTTNIGKLPKIQTRGDIKEEIIENVLKEIKYEREDLEDEDNISETHIAISIPEILQKALTLAEEEHKKEIENFFSKKLDSTESADIHTGRLFYVFKNLHKELIDKIFSTKSDNGEEL